MPCKTLKSKFIHTQDVIIIIGVIMRRIDLIKAPPLARAIPWFSNLCSTSRVWVVVAFFLLISFHMKGRCFHDSDALKNLQQKITKESNLLRNCKKLRYEKGLAALTYAILDHIAEVNPGGHVLDIGANDGSWSCYFACLFPHLNFQVVDPNPLFESLLPCKSKNIIPHNLAMSEKEGKINFHAEDGRDFVGDLDEKMDKEGNIQVTTLDKFFQMLSASPIYMHLDVEGYELSLMKGGPNILKFAQPIFTFEVHLNTSLALECIEFAEKNSYKVFLVNEICGIRDDCRNMLAIPSEGHQDLLLSPTFELACKSRLVIPINAENLRSQFLMAKTNVLPFQ